MNTENREFDFKAVKIKWKLKYRNGCLSDCLIFNNGEAAKMIHDIILNLLSPSADPSPIAKLLVSPMPCIAHAIPINTYKFSYFNFMRV